MAAAQPESKDDNETEIEQMFKKYEQRITDFAAILPDKRLPIPVVYGRKTTKKIGSNNILHDKFKPKRTEIYNSMKSCYPLIHGSVLSLAYDFISIKKQYGTAKEQQLYKDMTMVQFFHRLATKRCILFFQRWDEFSTQKGYNSNGGYENVGTDKEDQRCSIQDCLSYDELIVSALCGISSPTHFINNGGRANCGTVQEHDKRYPRLGYYIGLVGARFEKTSVMEYALMAVSEQQNIKQSGYGKLSQTSEEKELTESKDDTGTNEEFNQQMLELLSKNVNTSGYNACWKAFGKFYNRKYFPLFSEVAEEHNRNKSKSNYAPNWGGNVFLDIPMYKQRIRIALELFLFDADYRAQAQNDHRNGQLTGAYCHILGLGTGVWALNKQIQDTLIVEVTRDIIKENDLKNVDMVYFSWMYADALKETMEKYETDFKFDNPNYNYYMSDVNGHKISFDQGKRNPCDVLEKNYTQCSLVAMYAWDSNSFPGNEYYKGMLSASGDPAAAACSTISFVQNAMINQEYVTGENSMFYFTDQTGRYACHKLKEMQFEKDPKKWLEMSRNSIPVYARENVETGQRLEDNKVQKKKEIESLMHVKGEKIVCDKGKKTATVQFALIGNKKERLEVNLTTTVAELYAHAKFVSGYGKDFQLLGGFPPKLLKDAEATVEKCNLSGARITQKAI